MAAVRSAYAFSRFGHDLGGHDPVEDRERDDAEDQLTPEGQDRQAFAGLVLGGGRDNHLRDAGEVLHGFS